MTKVLILNDVLIKGGKERRIVELLKYSQLNTSIEFEIILMYEKIDFPEAYDLGYPIHVINWSNKKPIQGFRKLIAITKAFNPDIIHSWSSMTDIVSLVLKAKFGKPFITSMIAQTLQTHSLSHKDFFRSKIAFPFADVITSNTKAGLKSYNAPPAKSRCIYNGFNFERIKDLKDAAEFKIQLGIQHKFVVGMVAAFEERKDYDSLIEAAKKLLNSYPSQIVFILIGEGLFLEDMIQKAGNYADKDIIFTGLQNKVEDYINIFDIGILCTNSINHGEGISNAILEYMALSKPVIATEGGGTGEIMEDGYNGYLIPPLQPHILAEKIEYLMNNKNLGIEMGANAKQTILNNFQIETMCNGFYEIYNKLKPQAAAEHKLMNNSTAVKKN